LDYLFGASLFVHKHLPCTSLPFQECNIGFFPDVGGTWWIPRLKLYSQWHNKSYVGGVGNYLALTGARLRGDDLLYAGIATHYVQSNRLEELKQSLIDATSTGDDNADGGGDDNSSSKHLEDCAVGVLASFHDTSIDVQNSFLSRNRNDIDYAFDGKDSIEEILTSLEEMGPDSSFGTSTLSTLKLLSPTSLKVTLEGLKRGAKAQSVGEALQMEYRMAMAFMREGSDFYEGIRAALVDKDGSPKWNPANLHDVSEEIVNSYFEALGEDELCFLTRESAKL
jgi:enoyl-CoA hydratase/carnithine racemase